MQKRVMVCFFTVGFLVGFLGILVLSAYSHKATFLLTVVPHGKFKIKSIAMIGF